MKIYSYNAMSIEHRGSILSAVRNIVMENDNFVLCLQEGGSKKEYNIPETVGLHIAAFADDDSVHKPNMLTLSSGLAPRQCEKIIFPRITSDIWKFLFWLFYRSEVPQHTALITYYELPTGDSLVVVNVHFDVLGGLELKTKQMQMIKECLEKRTIDKVVIVGDYNATSNKIVRQLCSVLGSEYSVVGDPKAVTSSIRHTMSGVLLGKWIQPILKFFRLTRFFDSRRDWIITKNIKLISETILSEHIGSDHYPIVYEIE